MWFLDFFVQLLITVSLINHQFQRLLKPDGFRAPKSWTDPVQEHWPIISCNAELQICKLGLHPGISKAVGSTTKSVTAFRPVCIVILVGSAHVSGQLGHWWGDKDIVSAELTCCEWFVVMFVAHGGATAKNTIFQTSWLERLGMPCFRSWFLVV